MDMLKQLRMEAGYTQDDVAEKLDVSRNVAAEIENGRDLKESEIVALSKLYNVRPDTILFRNHEQQQPGNEVNFCETCNIRERVITLAGALKAHGHFKSAGHLRKLLAGEIEEDN